MVTQGFRKRACAVVLVKEVKNPIKLAREMLVRGEKDGSRGGDLNGRAGGAQGHCCLGGETVENLAKGWGLDMVNESYFWTRRRWDEHKRGLHESEDERTLRQKTPDKVSLFLKAKDEGYALHNEYEEHQEDQYRWPLFPEQDSGWDGQAYLPQGTVGCVALDQNGTMCVATSTGGLTNKLSGRIGDTPTIGAGFWAEKWNQQSFENRTRQPQDLSSRIPAALNNIADGLRNFMGDCIPKFSDYQELLSFQELGPEKAEESMSSIKAVAMSGTGNGDSFLRLAAARTAGAIVRFSPDRTLASSVNQIAGSGGELQRSAGDRWGETGEGEGGIIGIELVGGRGTVVFDFNCGGMFRCWVDDHGRERVMVFKDEY
ncbi:MAG: hypothetical protein ASARMPREDX12_006241 [Alectoria sarmentosa]|nr:MAG: hypothetical protein ASARMPREDX12_006241 [Alectoria sarmentosa]